MELVIRDEKAKVEPKVELFLEKDSLRRGAIKLMVVLSNEGEDRKEHLITFLSDGKVLLSAGISKRFGFDLDSTGSLRTSQGEK